MDEKIIKVSTFEPRWYQKDLINALEHQGKKKFVIVWPRRCLSGNTHIIMIDGSWKFLRDIQVGDKILSWNGKRFVPDIVKNKWSTGIKETKIIQAPGYIPITTSLDHKFAVVNKTIEDICWIAARNLKEDTIVLNYNNNSNYSLNKIRIKDGKPEELFDIETTINHNFIANGYIVHNSGKDVAALNLILRQAFKRVGTYYYLYPKYEQCRRAIWDAILITGEKFLDFIPHNLIAKKNNVEMKITLINGSIIQFNGADNADCLRGTNPVGVIFSEYSRVNHPEAYNGVIAPILAANGGFVIFISTPNGHNAFYDVYQHAKSGKDSEWYYKILTVNDTKHVTLDVLDKEKERMSEEMYLQEFFCSFSIANTGVYYARYLDKAYAEQRIGFVPHDSSYQVYTAWDLGFRCPSVIIFFQVIGRKICIIDLYHKNNEDLSHYVSILRSYSETKGYQYAKHFAPHDAKNHELSTGKTRLQILKQLGLTMKVLPKSLLNDGIEIVRHTFKRIFIDKNNCSLLLDALEHYSRKWDDKAKRFIDKDKEDWSTDYADCLRYVCNSLPYIDTNERSPEEFDKRYKELVYGSNSNLPPIFRDY